MSKWLGFFITLFLLSSISAICEDGQIDINSASLEELDELYGIGPAKAQAIIDARPYNPVDELVNAYGIGEATLNNIKSHGLACVSESEVDNYEDTGEEVLTETPEWESVPPIKSDNSPKVLDTIKLSSPESGTKNIKSNSGENKLYTGNYAVYGLIAFCILLGVLFLRKKRQISEFE